MNTVFRIIAPVMLLSGGEALAATVNTQAEYTVTNAVTTQLASRITSTDNQSVSSVFGTPYELTLTPTTQVENVISIRLPGATRSNLVNQSLWSDGTQNGGTTQSQCTATISVQAPVSSPTDGNGLVVALRKNDSTGTGAIAGDLAIARYQNGLTAPTTIQDDGTNNVFTMPSAFTVALNSPNVSRFTIQYAFLSDGPDVVTITNDDNPTQAMSFSISDDMGIFDASTTGLTIALGFADGWARQVAQPTGYRFNEIDAEVSFKQVPYTLPEPTLASLLLAGGVSLATRRRRENCSVTKGDFRSRMARQKSSR